LEGLEDRWLLSTLTVTSVANSGHGSLRADIAAAHSGDTINFAPSLDGKTITLTSGELLINKSLTIEGPGAGQLTISGNNHSRAFEVNATQPVFLSGLTISDGVVGGSLSGGGILNDTTLTVSGCTISRCHGSYYGGGIENGGTMTISNCDISGNTAAFGAGIGNGGTLTVSGSNISGNSAAPSDGVGGGIWNKGTMTISQCTLDYNDASVNGGGIYNQLLGNLTISQCTLSNNVSYSIYGSGGGGGIYTDGGITVSGSTLYNNDAYFEGGGIYSHHKTTTLTNCTLSNNVTKMAAGGGLFVDSYSTATLTNCTLSGNKSPGIGGGIYVNGFPSEGILNLTNTIVAGNFGADDIFGPVATADHNLVGSATNGFWNTIVNGVNGNIVGVDPLLGPLQNNGGPTLTMALLAGSPAIGNADNALAPVTDQRGFIRFDLVGEMTDIGAFEV
jgi:hypothetical protein